MRRLASSVCGPFPQQVSRRCRATPLGLLTLVATLSSLAAAAGESLSCTTNAVNFETNPFAASQGTVTIRLSDETQVEGGEATGMWTAAAGGRAHGSSFVTATAETCAKGCPYTKGKDGAIQLWSPKPMALSQLAEGELLVLASFDPVTREIKVSSFRDKQMAALERGHCPDGDSKPARDREPAE